MKPDSHQLPGNAIDAQSSQSPERVAELIHHVAQKDRQAFALLYQATAPKLLGTVLRILRDRA